MTIISLIAAIDEAGGLGNNNKLLCHLPADLQHFKTITMGRPIIMGRKTYDSIGRPLPGRENIVLSRSPIHIEKVLVVASLQEALNKNKGFDEVFIIGGAELFTQSLEIATRLYITKIHYQFKADVFFPKIDEIVWTCLKEEFRPHDEKNAYDMTFYTYVKN
jgi:dihydrofolate reductase